MHKQVNKQSRIVSITNEREATVVLGVSNLCFQDGDYVKFAEVKGMTEIN